MKMPIIYPVIMALLVLSGCAQKGFDYHDASDIPEGPGIFSEGGGATISVKGLAAKDYTGSAGPTRFLEWKQEFERANEHRKYEMWLELINE